MSSQDHLDEGGEPTADRRDHRADGESPMATLRRLPALRVLGQLPVPVVAVSGGGAILFANEAFATLVGVTRETLHAMSFADVFEPAARADSAVSLIQKHAEALVALSHSDGSTIRAVMSRSALQRAHEQIALVTFRDVTEQLWVDGR
ncbi:PAS domain-containing protein [Mycolicibacterium sp.]|uniref:PAS domain-containing protein n=1 Tax=Mycolicibacterium sp. TaxID=2320850 RepID=UPI0025D173A2|nr:PAS domain-containing protein [Mycolicibacterium sp.]